MTWQWVALILGLAFNVTIIVVAIMYMPDPQKHEERISRVERLSQFPQPEMEQKH